MPASRSRTTVTATTATAVNTADSISAVNAHLRRDLLRTARQLRYSSGRDPELPLRGGLGRPALRERAAGAAGLRV